MFDNFTKQIRQKSREQYRERAFELVTDRRIWIQENPERAFICALVGGMIFVLLFKVFLVFIALAVLIGVLVWVVALPEQQRVEEFSASPSPPSTNGYESSISSPVNPRDEQSI